MKSLNYLFSCALLLALHSSFLYGSDETISSRVETAATMPTSPLTVSDAGLAIELPSFAPQVSYTLISSNNHEFEISTEEWEKLSEQFVEFEQDGNRIFLSSKSNEIYKRISSLRNVEVNWNRVGHSYEKNKVKFVNHLRIIGAQSAHDRGIYGKGVNIALIDSKGNEIPAYKYFNFNKRTRDCNAVQSTFSKHTIFLLNIIGGPNGVAPLANLDVYNVDFPEIHVSDLLEKSKRIESELENTEGQ